MENQFKGNKAPWVACGDEYENDRIIVYSDEGIQPHICYSPDYAIDNEVHEANMALIAAAPDLLESLQTFIRLRELMIYDDKDLFNEAYKSEAVAVNDCFEKAKSAIKKALNQK